MNVFTGRGYHVTTIGPETKPLTDVHVANIQVGFLTVKCTIQNRLALFWDVCCSDMCVYPATVQPATVQTSC